MTTRTVSRTVCFFLALVTLAALASCSKKAEKPLQLGSVDDIKDKSFCVLVGNLHAIYIAEHYPYAKQLHYNSAPDQLLALEAGQCEVMLVDGGQAPAILAERTSLGEIADSVYMMDIAFAVGKGNSALLSELDQFIDTVRATGELDLVLSNWMHKTDSMPPPVPPTEGSKTLRIGTTGTDLPITFLKDGQLAGYDIELLTRFAQRHGYKVEYSKMDFGALIPALASQKVDLIADNITVSKERAEKVDFTRPYKREPVSAIALKKNIKTP